MAAVIPLALLFLYTLQLFYLRTSRQLRHMDLEAKSPLYTHLLETVQGLSTIRSFGWSSSTLASGLNFLDISQRPYYLLYCIQRWLNLVLDLFVAGLATIFVGVTVSITDVASSGSIALGLLNLLSLNTSLAYMITTWTEMETSLGAIARLKDLERDTPKEAQDCELRIPERSWPQNGTIVFDKVEVAYGYVCAKYNLIPFLTPSSSESEPVLRNISFTIEAGQKVAICGRTGR